MPDFAERGSQRWLQVAVDRRPDLIQRSINPSLGSLTSIEWILPVKTTSFKEARDWNALRLCGVTSLPKRDLKDFWPARGPVWDGLAKTSDGEILLVEAKANIPELASPGTKATGNSLALILKTMKEVRAKLAPRSKAPWTEIFFQYTNRLAFLYLLRVLNNVPARLVNIFFVNSRDVNGPSSSDEWIGALRLMNSVLGLGESHVLKPYMHTAFLDVAEIQPTTV